VIAEKLERENSQIRFETLKSQLNPHFLFNSLNVLSSLIKHDSDKAQYFVDEFSSVYRYTLDVIEKPVVELREEINFAKSFLYLQKIRFDNAVDMEINVDASKLNDLVPPLAIQTLLENAFKHNRASVDNPLKINIYDEDDGLVVINNLQPKIKGDDSKGVGLNNLRKRYELLGEKLPQFSFTEKEYIAKIPLIKPE
jgi:LytS/YehU family sensor histidine kinase